MNISDKLKIVLKGVEIHTDIEDIAQKIENAQSENRPLQVKLGLDPTAPDIHLGHAVVLRKIRQLQDIGCSATIVIGDFTGMIGDPTGKSKARKQLSKSEVLENAQTYKKQIFKIIDPDKTKLCFNSQWLSELNFEDVINLAGTTTVARMLERDDFSNRYQQNKPISLHEFFYPLMQAYDSVAVKADIELGGTDQVFNIHMGRKVQKEYKQEPQICLFMPLLEGINGVEKMSKSLGNYVGINESADVMFQKIMKIPDDMILKYFTLCTDIWIDDIDIIKSRLEGGENPRDIKMELAHEIAKLYHGSTESDKALKNFEKAFQQGVVPENTPVIVIDNSDSRGFSFISKLVSGGFYKSNGEVRRLIKQNAVSLDGVKMNTPEELDVMKEGSIIKIGKGKYYIVKLSQ